MRINAWQWHMAHVSWIHMQKTRDLGYSRRNGSILVLNVLSWTRRRNRESNMGPLGYCGRWSRNKKWSKLLFANGLIGGCNLSKQVYMYHSQMSSPSHTRSHLLPKSSLQNGHPGCLYASFHTWLYTCLMDFKITTCFLQS